MLGSTLVVPKVEGGPPLGSVDFATMVIVFLFSVRICF